MEIQFYDVNTLTYIIVTLMFLSVARVLACMKC